MGLSALSRMRRNRGDKGVVDEFFGDQIMRYICGGTLFSKSKSLGLGGGAPTFKSSLST
jgi:hypothetical protein